MTDVDSQHRKPASDCIWYVLATVAGEPQSLQALATVGHQNAYFWNGLMPRRIATYGDAFSSKITPPLNLPELTDTDRRRIREALDTRGFRRPELFLSTGDAGA